MTSWNVSNFMVRYFTKFAWLYSFSRSHKTTKYLSGSAPGIPWNISRSALKCWASHQQVSVCSQSPSVFAVKKESQVSMLGSSPDCIWGRTVALRGDGRLDGGDSTGVTTLQLTSQSICNIHNHYSQRVVKCLLILSNPSKWQINICQWQCRADDKLMSMSWY